MAKKGFLAVLAALAITGVAQAQITISGGLALSYMSASMGNSGGTSTLEGGMGWGGNVYVDYLLPIGIPLSVGGEIGIDATTLTVTQKDHFNNFEREEALGLVLPLLLRVAYHFDLMPKLDLYVVGKIGGAFGSVLSGSADGGGGGFAFGIDVGVSYYFTQSIGIFVEAGFDDYMTSSEKESDDYGMTDGYGMTGMTTYTYDFPFYRFFTAGISVKF